VIARLQSPRVQIGLASLRRGSLFRDPASPPRAQRTHRLCVIADMIEKRRAARTVVILRLIFALIRSFGHPHNHFSSFSGPGGRAAGRENSAHTNRLPFPLHVAYAISILLAASLVTGTSRYPARFFPYSRCHNTLSPAGDHR
jgi:hypothetical protein